MNIEYSDFEKYLKRIEKQIRLDESIHAVCRNAYSDNLDLEIMFPTMIDDVIELLAKAANDQGDWISYWVYELNCGAKYEDGMVIDVNGNIIKLKSIRDLWDMLSNNS